MCVCVHASRPQTGITPVLYYQEEVKEGRLFSSHSEACWEDSVHGTSPESIRLIVISLYAPIKY